MTHYSGLDCDDETTVQITNYFQPPIHLSHKPVPDLTAFLKQPQTQHNAVNNTHTVHLNVGGTFYTTTWSTLLRVPNTYFHAMHNSNQWGDSNDSTVFIDRDGSVFNYILNYMRDNNLHSIQHCKNIELLTRLQTESQYYLLTDLSATIQERIDTLVQLEYTHATQQNMMHEQLHTVVSTALNTPSKSYPVSRSGSDCSRLMHDSTPMRSTSSTAFRNLDFGNSLSSIQYNNSVPLAVSADWQFTTDSDF